MKPKWLERYLILAPYFTLCTTQELFNKAVKHLKEKPYSGVNEGQGATTHFFKNKTGHSVAIVCLFDYKNQDIEQIFSLLAHEATHIWQDVRDEIGEKNPSHEFEAYAIQNICQRLFYEFNRQTKKKSKG